jgi:hypothetical protein
VDRFDLSRTPNFEPRRGPAVPGFLAAAGAPVLFMPIRCAPEAEVAAWLATLRAGTGAPGVLEGFTQKTLRQWMRAQDGRRAFTVVRHPLARAHAAFVDRILSGACGEVHAVLRRAYKLDLPPPHRVARLDRAAFRDSFLGFLRFLKGNVAGQTAVRIDAGWASQSALIDGFSQLVPPDAVLREERLAEGLAYLAAEVGAGPGGPSGPPPPPAFAAPFDLAQIVDAEVQAAARAAYPHDYDRFGFGDWVPPQGPGAR